MGRGAQISINILDRGYGADSQFPLFLRGKNGRHRYFGTYCEPRTPCLLSENEMLVLPRYLKGHWATRLALNQAFEAESRNTRNVDFIPVDVGYHAWKHNIKLEECTA